MKLKVQTEPFLTALKDVQRIAPAEYINLEAEGKHLRLSAASTGASIIITVAGASIETKGTCAVPFATLEGVLKKRKEVSLELDGESLKFKASGATKYAGSLTAVPYVAVKITREEATLKLEEDTQAKISEILSNVALTSVNLKGQDILPITLRLSSEGIEAACASRNHMAYAVYKLKAFKKTKDFCLAPTLLPLIDTVSRKAAYKLAVTENSVYAENDTFQIRFATQQFDRYVTLESVKSFLANRKKAEATVKAKTEDVLSTFQNMLSLYEQNSFIELVCKDSSVRISTKTRFGNAAENLAGSLKGSFKKPYGVHPKIFEDLLNKCKANNLKIGFHDGVALSLEQDKADVTYYYSCSTSKL